ncbi:transketolase [Patescibacteria group bacterium]|nr:transketolase [Patescibacteria group bacterium]
MDYEKYKEKAQIIREEMLKMLAKAGSGHTAGPLGMIDILVALYFGILKHDPKNPDWEDRDRVIYSHGHTCPALYTVMAEIGYFPKSELDSLRKFGAPLQGHPHKEWLKGIETSSGPLGSGLSQAVGMALAEKIDNKDSDKKFYCLMSDGELQEGQVWEALMLGGYKKLNNLIAVIDRNHIQISGKTEDVLGLEPLRDKFEAFNWDVLEVDGHDYEQLFGAFETAKKITDGPVVIIAHTIPGKGFKEFENDYTWHGKVPSQEMVDKILKTNAD